MNSRIRPVPGRDTDRGYTGYLDRIGELVSGYVKRFERGDIIVDLGGVEAIMPRSEQARHERFSQGERIKSVITAVNERSKGPKVFIWRPSLTQINSSWQRVRVIEMFGLRQN